MDQDNTAKKCTNSEALQSTGKCLVNVLKYFGIRLLCKTFLLPFTKTMLHLAISYAIFQYA